MTPEELQAISQAVKEAVPQANPMGPILIGFLGAVFGAASAIVSNLILERYKRKAQQNAILAALTSEICALIGIIEARGYLADIQNRIDAAEQAPGVLFKLEIRVPGHYCRIYQQNADKIGLLPIERAREIIAFYQALDAVVQDVIPGGALNNPGMDRDGFVRGKAILEKALALGASVVKRGSCSA